jgi:DNA mismatch repair ATPase MutS
MKEYSIDVSRIEDLQTLNDVHELEKIFARAKSTIVNGEKVILVRKTSQQPPQKFDELTSLKELQQYRDSVFRYIRF